MTLKIGLTQRVEEVASYNERRDCLDQRWTELAEYLHMCCLPLPNRVGDAGVYASILQLDGLILTGGNSLSAIGDQADAALERDAFEDSLLLWASQEKVPVLGVCRGMQIINHFCGGSLAAVKGHVACRHGLECLPVCPDFRPQVTVNSYHKYAVFPSGLGKQLEPLVRAHDGTIEAFRHNDLPWYGIMWHPERETPFNEGDLNLITAIFR
jgi:putative glutamine amidotransferase